MSGELVPRTRAALLSGIAALERRRDGPPRDLWRAALRLEHIILADVLSPAEERKSWREWSSPRRRFVGGSSPRSRP